MKNILLILADELRADALGCYGNSQVHTPQADALAKKGILFENHFTVHGKCVPSRSALYSGRYPNLGGHRTLGIELRPGEENLAWYLKRNGWETRLIQRNHTIDESWIGENFTHWDRKEGPNPHFIQGSGVDETDLRLFNWGVIEDPSYRSQDRIHTELLCQWLRGRPRGGAPFFANLNWINPHPPYHSERKYADLYQNKTLLLKPGAEAVKGDRGSYWSVIRRELGAEALSGTRRQNILRNYYGQVSACDDLLGDIVKTLAETGLWDETILVFASDHGDYAGQYGLVEKWDTGFEDCITHIPMVISGGGLPSGERISSLTETVDVFPTLCDLMGLERPKGLSGKSFSKIWEPGNDTHREDVFAEGGHEPELLSVPIAPESHHSFIAAYQAKARVRNHSPESLCRSKMIRTERYKYIWRSAEKPELYDLKEDPDECVNKANDPAYEKICHEMKDRLLNRLIANEETRPWDPKPIA